MRRPWEAVSQVAGIVLGPSPMTSYQVTASHWVRDGAGGHDWLVVGSHEHLQAAVAAGGGEAGRGSTDHRPN